MEEEEKEFIAEWKATRVQGRIIFALKEALIKGSIFCIAIELGQGFLFNPDRYSFDLKRNLMRLTVFVVGYFIYGLWKWNKSEKRFQQFMESEKGNQITSTPPSTFP
jgi:hypothetical protein